MPSLAERVRTATSVDTPRVPPPHVPWVGLAPDLRSTEEVLFVARSNALLELSLQRRGVSTVRVWTVQEARRRMYGQVFAMVVVEPDLGADDGVAFAVDAKQGATRMFSPLWRRVPFVVLPEAGDNQAVLLTGADDAEAVTGDREQLVTAIVRLLRQTRTPGDHGSQT